MIRDTYRDYVTGLELYEAAGPNHAAYINSVCDLLMENSGGCNVTSATLAVVYKHEADVAFINVSFNSAAWTGR